MTTNRPAWLTPANALTGLRLSLAPAIAYTIVNEFYAISGCLFVVAVITDLTDGPLARWRHEASASGALFDHAVDAMFVAIALGALAWMATLTPLLPLLVVAAFLQYTFDSRALQGRHLRASRIGRYNGIGYFVMVGIPVIRDALGLTWPSGEVVAVIAWLLVATTLVSMTDRAVARINTRRDA